MNGDVDDIVDAATRRPRALFAIGAMGVLGGVLLALAGLNWIPFEFGVLAIVLLAASALSFLAVGYVDERRSGTGRTRSASRSLRRSVSWAFSLLP